VLVLSSSALQAILEECILLSYACNNPFKKIRAIFITFICFLELIVSTNGWLSELSEWVALFLTG